MHTFEEHNLKNAIFTCKHNKLNCHSVLRNVTEDFQQRTEITKNSMLCDQSLCVKSVSTVITSVKCSTFHIIIL